MERKKSLIIVIVITLITIISIVLFNSSKKYNHYLLSKSEWNKITEVRKEAAGIKIESIKFNDYDLFIDEESNTIYYSVVDSRNKNNPSISYKASGNEKLAVNNKIDKMSINKIMIYNDKNYHIYDLVLTDYPIIDIQYETKNNKYENNNAEFTIFDNHVNSQQRIVKSTGKITDVYHNQKMFLFSLTTTSLGRNKRKNEISILGLDKNNKYELIYTEQTDEMTKYVNLFINNKYTGIYKIDYQK